MDTVARDFALIEKVLDVFVKGNAGSLDPLSDEERERLAALMADNFATQVLTDGFYHADPQSGNVLIKDAPDSPAPVQSARGRARRRKAAAAAPEKPAC